MAKIKSFTSLEQSKKLAEFLPPESADMNYCNMCLKGVMYADSFKAGLSSYEDATKMNQENIDFYLNGTDYKGIIAWEVLPCWSLAALLSVLPETITKYIDDERCQKTFRLNLFRSYYHCCSYSFAPSISDDDGNNTLYCIGRDNWVDACVAMVEKLNELKML